MLITLEKCFAYYLNKYPRLYLSSSLELSKMKFYDHFLNTIGNQFKKVEDLYSDLSLADTDMFDIPEKYISDTDIYCCYFSEDKRYTTNYIFLTEEEASLNPLVVTKTKIKKNDFFLPFDNFNKKYSIVWTSEIDNFDLPSLKEILWFYTECQKHFHSDDKYDIFLRCKIGTPQFEQSIEEQNDYFLKMRKESMTDQEYFDLISEKYQIKFTGDVKQFLIDRAEKKLNLVLQFINETIAMVENKIKNY